MKKVIVIGSGFSGLSVATKLADAGFDVTIIEKTKLRVAELGFSVNWDLFLIWGQVGIGCLMFLKGIFAEFEKKPSDFYELIRLDPSYKVIFNDKEFIDLPAKLEQLKEVFENVETGSSKRLDEFLRESKYKYDVGIGEFVWKPSISITEFFDIRLVSKAISLDLFASFGKHIRKFFKHERLLQLMEFPILFLGATPQNTPALYSLMNYAEIALGTWYPMGGMHEIVKGMVSLAKEKGVKFVFDEPVVKIDIQNKEAKRVLTEKHIYNVDVVVGGADYEHIESKLLNDENRNYSNAYWDKRVMAPSSLLFYLGINRKVEKLTHHNLFFDEDFSVHANEIYENPKWPSKPLFYASAPSKTDSSVAPDACENLFVLIPIAPNLEDSEELREKYYHIVMERLEKFVGHSVRNYVVYKRSFAVDDFKTEYNSYKGNAYGLANTLMQTAFLKPNIKNKKVKNLYYTGQLTIPGPGVPPSLISGLVVAKQIMKEHL